MRTLVEIHTDGSCSPNPGVGGWAAILVAPERGEYRKEISGAEEKTTNNRMELYAAIQALEALKHPCAVVIHTDSKYLQKAFVNRWLRRWAANNWQTQQKTPVANEDLWRELIRLTQVHEVEWKWVRGHADNELNERCDELAVAARNGLAAKMRRCG